MREAAIEMQAKAPFDVSNSRLLTEICKIRDHIEMTKKLKEFLYKKKK